MMIILLNDKYLYMTVCKYLLFIQYQFKYLHECIINGKMVTRGTIRQIVVLMFIKLHMN